MVVEDVVPILKDVNHFRSREGCKHSHACLQNAAASCTEAQ